MKLEAPTSPAPSRVLIVTGTQRFGQLTFTIDD